MAAAANGDELRFTYQLSGSPRGTQIAALAIDTPEGLAASARLAVTARAEQPMRVSIQLRGGEGVTDRWERTVFVDRFAEDRTVDFDDLVPVGQTHTLKPPLASIRTILFVIETTHSKPGSSGSLWLRRVELQR